MKVKRFFFSVALPLFLAALILALGALIPSVMLRRQAQSYARTVSAVEISDVRPYGDGYEQTKQSLLDAIHVLDNAYYVEDAERWSTETGNALERMFQFLQGWNEHLSSRGWVLDLLDVLDVVSVNRLENAAAEHQVIVAEAYEQKSGYVSSFSLDPDTGTPVRMDLNTYIGGYIDPEALWSSLLETYQERCGLMFNLNYVSYTTLGDGETLDTSQESFLEAVEVGKVPQAHFFALSSDLTFRLELYVSCFYNDDWNISVQLWENTEGLPEGPEEFITDSSQTVDNSVAIG